MYASTAVFSIREQLIQNIFDTLYLKHIAYWNHQLTTIINENANYQGRIISDNTFYGIHYAGKNWIVPEPGRTEEFQFEIILMHEDIPGFEARVINVTSNRAELDIEMYEVKRFLGGLLVFTPPLELFEEILGNAIYRRVEQYFKQFTTTESWTKYSEKAFRTFTEEYSYLVDVINQRIMMNLITSDALRI